MKVLLTFLLILCFKQTILYSQTPDEVLSKKLIENYLNTKIDNSGLIDTDGSVYRFHKTMSIRDTGKVNYLLTVLVDTKPEDDCQPCPVDVLILEWMIDKPNDTILKFNKLKIESSGTFGEINGIFEYKLLGSFERIPIFLYHDNRVEDGKGIFRFHHTYLISQGKIVDTLFESYYSNEETRVVHKNNIIDCKSKFLFNNENGVLRYVKTGVIYDSVVYEEVMYYLHEGELHRSFITQNKNEIEYKGLNIRFMDSKETVYSLNDIKKEGIFVCSENYPLSRIVLTPKKSYNYNNKVKIELYCLDGSDITETCYRTDDDTSEILMFKTNYFYVYEYDFKKSHILSLIPWINYQRGMYRIKIFLQYEEYQEVIYHPVLDMFYNVTYHS
jgi:hypothetical protein